MIKTSVNFEKMEELIKVLATIKKAMLDNFSTLNKNFDKIESNWDGKKSFDTLVSIPNIKNKNQEIIATTESCENLLKAALDSYKLSTSGEVVALDQKISLVDPSLISSETVVTEIISDSSYITSPGLMTSSEYIDNELDKVIAYTLLGNGANPFDSENMEELINSYNNTENVSSKGAIFLEEERKGIETLQNKLKENNLWGTPEGSAILMHYVVKTGLKIPTHPTTETDGVGNYRHLNVNDGWLDANKNGLDCNNLQAWVAINSGRMEENRHVYVASPNTIGSISIGSKDLSASSLYDMGIRPGDFAGRNNHATVFMHEDDENIYVYESVSNEAIKNRGVSQHGTMITVIPKDPNTNIPKGPGTVLYPRSHINYFVPFENIRQVNNPANPKTIIK